MAKKTNQPGIYDQKIQWMPAKDMLDRRHRLNWREHPKRQRLAFNALKSKVGWAGVILVNEVTGNILDGHMRLEEAAKKGEPAPFVFGRWSEEEEKLVLLQHDSIGLMAHTNQEALKNLTKIANQNLDSLKSKMPTKDLEKLKQTTQDLADFSGREESGAILDQKRRVRVRKNVDLDEDSSEVPEVKGNFNGTVYEEPEPKNDIIFSSNLLYGFPPLLTDKIATPDMLPTSVWTNRGEEPDERTYFCASVISSLPENKDGGCLGFFTEDWRFEDTFAYAAEFLTELQEEDWTCLLAPEFSTYWNWPLAARIWNVYRSRWVARYWQEAGFFVVPVIQDLGTEKSVTGNMDLVGTLPSPCPTLALQTRSKRASKENPKLWERFHQHAKLWIETVRPEAVLIYGAENRKYYEGSLPQSVSAQQVGKLKRKVRYIFLESYIHQRLNKSVKR